MKELSIGQIGIIDGVKVKCCRVNPYTVENCASCAFKDVKGCVSVLREGHRWTMAKCAALTHCNNRSDGFHVYFKRIEL